MNLKKIIFLSLFSIALSATSFAQKIGHLNLGNMLESLPQSKAANDSLTVLQKKLSDKGAEMAKLFEADYTKYVTEANEGKLSAIDQKKRETDLQKRQGELQEYQQTAQQQLEQKRQTLLEPILTKLEAVIKEVAKENGYQLIIDTSTSVLLFAQETEDIAPLVKKKLGI